MTYPPQPRPYGQSGGYGQPYPGYPGHPQQPGYPQRYPGQPQQYPGQPDYRGQFPNQPYQGQGGGYGQQYPDPGYHGQPGYGPPYQEQPAGYPGAGYPRQQPGYGMPTGDVPPPPPPEPPKRGGKTGLVVGISLAVVLLAGAAVAITGFWAPGFFHDDAVEQDSSLAADTSPGSATPPSSPAESAPEANTENAENTEAPPQPSVSDSEEIRRITDTVVAGINNRDAATVKPVSCDPGNERQADYDGFPGDLTASVSGEPRINGSDATVPLTLRRTDTSKSVVLTLHRTGGAWCASGITSP